MNRDRNPSEVLGWLTTCANYTAFSFSEPPPYREPEQASNGNMRESLDSTESRRGRNGEGVTVQTVSAGRD
jgi:hypothetical protein